MEMRAGYKRTDAGIIPEDWKVNTLGEIGDVRMCKRVLKQQTRSNGDVPFYKIGTFGGVADAYINHSLFEDFKRRYSYPKKGDVLISAAGTIGRSVIFDGSPSYFQDSNIVWIENDESKATNEYLWHRYQVTKWAVSHGGTVARLYNDSLRTKIHIPLPTLSEQRAISQALSDVDALIATLDRLVAKKHDIKQATMQQLLTGKTRLPGFSGKWESKRLTDMADIIKGNTLSKSLLSESGINPCILYGELFTTYGRVITKTVSFTNSPEGVKSLSGDVLLPGSTTTTGADLATASALLLDGVALGGDINIVRQKGIGYDPAFLACYLTHVARNEIAELAQGTTIHHLYGKDLKGLSLSLPHHTEQSAIASVISDMDTELTAMEARRDKTRALKQGMMQELLTGKTRLI